MAASSTPKVTTLLDDNGNLHNPLPGSNACPYGITCNGGSFATNGTAKKHYHACSHFLERAQELVNSTLTIGKANVNEENENATPSKKATTLLDDNGNLHNPLPGSNACPYGITCNGGSFATNGTAKKHYHACSHFLERAQELVNSTLTIGKANLNEENENATPSKKATTLLDANGEFHSPSGMKAPHYCPFCGVKFEEKGVPTKHLPDCPFFKNKLFKAPLQVIVTDETVTDENTKLKAEIAKMKAFIAGLVRDASAFVQEKE